MIYTLCAELADNSGADNIFGKWKTVIVSVVGAFMITVVIRLVLRGCGLALCITGFMVRETALSQTTQLSLSLSVSPFPFPQLNG